MRAQLRRVAPVRFAYYLAKGFLPYAEFIVRPCGTTSVSQRLQLVARIHRITRSIRCMHSEREILAVIRAILAMPAATDGVCVEAGCFKGGSTAKLSLAAELAGRRLVVFDSFEGIPSHEEEHRTNIFGREVAFPEGSYRGALEEVRANVERFGAIQVCDFVAGWFEDTLPSFRLPVAVAYVDVDLASSTRTCVQYIFPRLVAHGTMFSQDGHLPLVLDALADAEFWSKDVGCTKPEIRGAGQEKLVSMVKAPDLEALATLSPG